jgi:hypothetical protein
VKLNVPRMMRVENWEDFGLEDGELEKGVMIGRDNRK